MTGTRTKVTRLVVAALLVLPAIVASVSPSAAAPSQQDVEAAKARLAQLQEQFSALNEQWNEARYQLQQTQEHLAEAKAMKESAEQDAAAARAQLADRAVQAYTDMGSQYEALLSANSMTEFSDRLEFLGSITQTDSDLATKADEAAQRAAWATQEYDRAVADAQAKADAMNAQRDQAQANLNEQAQVASQLQADYSAWLQAQQAALDAQQQPRHLHHAAPTDRWRWRWRRLRARPRRQRRRRPRSRPPGPCLGTPYVFGAAGSQRVRLLGPDLVGVGAGRRLPAALGLSPVLLAAARAAGPGPARRHHLLRQLRPPRGALHRWRSDHPRAPPRPRRRGPSTTRCTATTRP